MKQRSTAYGGASLRSIALTLVAGAALFAGPAALAGGYFGAGIGQSDYRDADLVQDSCAAFGFVCPVDETDTAFKFFGGYRFGDYLAIEAAYVSLGEASAELPAAITLTADTQGLVVAIVPTVPIGRRVSVFVKGGVFVWDVKLDAESPVLNASESAEGAGADTVLGAGLAVRVGEQGAVRLEWERYKIDEDVEFRGEDINVSTEIDLLSASFVYRF